MPVNQLHYSSRRTFLATAMAVVGVASFRHRTIRAADPIESAWCKSPHNPILSLGPAGAFDSHNIMSPAVARRDGRCFLFYAGGSAGPKTNEDYVRYQLGLALSDDGEHFRRIGRPLLELGQRDNFHCCPALLRKPDGELRIEDGLWHMLYNGNRADDVEHATSSDGLTWTKDPRSPVFRAAYAPSIVRTEDEYRLYHVHKPPRKDGRAVPWEVHLAAGPDLYSLRAHAANPVLTLSQPWEKANLFYPYVLREGDTWLLFYAAYWSGHPQGKQATAIGLATSGDGVAWTKSEQNPILTPTPDSEFDSVYTSAQSVIRDGDGYRMYYGARIDLVHKYFAIGLATKQ